MATRNTSRKRWQRLVYDISLTSFILIFLFGCNYFRPIVQNYQDSEIPPDQIAAIVDGCWSINRLWEVKSEPPWVLIWELKESTFSDNRVRQFKLKPGNYEIFIEDNYRGLQSVTIPFRELFRVQLKAGHKHRVDYSHESHWLENYWVQYYWIEDLTTGEVVGGRKP